MSNLICRTIPGPSLICIIFGMSSVLVQSAFAFEFETGNPDLKLRWDNTVRYTLADRVHGQSSNLINGPITTNQDDGDRSFNKGVISNRLDLFSEFEVTYKNNFGARVSAAAWYDTIYNRSNDNNSPSTFNQLSVPYNQFT